MSVADRWELHKLQFILILLALMKRAEVIRNRAFEIVADRLSPYWERFSAMYDTATDGGDGTLFA